VVAVRWYDPELNKIIHHGPILVHSVFEHAINLVNQHAMMTLVSSSKPKAPLTWVCDVDSFSKHHVKHGMTCHVLSNQLHIGELVIQLNSCPIHELDQIDDNFNASNDVLKGCESLLSWSISQPVNEGAMGLFHEHDDIMSIYFVKKLKSYLSSFDIQWFKEFIGCGHGLTPSGDDVLTGMMAMAHAFNHQGFIHVVSKLCEPQLHKTTDVSRVMLKHAFNGRFNDYQSKLIQAISVNKDVHEFANQCSTLGHTSGYDFIVGVLMYYFMIKKGATYA
jgi:hypothetical protein